MLMIKGFWKNMQMLCNIFSFIGSRLNEQLMNCPGLIHYVALERFLGATWPEMASIVRSL